MGRSLTGRWIDETSERVVDLTKFYWRYQQVVETLTFSWRRGPPEMADSQKVSALENIVLPLARDGTTVDMLLGATVFYRLDGGEI
jgi:hypothetical protein